MKRGAEEVSPSASAEAEGPLKWVPVRERKKARHHRTTSHVSSVNEEDEKSRSLLEQKVVELKRRELLGEPEVSEEAQKKKEIDEEILKSFEEFKPLKTVRELAKDIEYTTNLTTGMSREEVDAIRKEWHIMVSGEDIPPLCRNFKDLMLPRPLLEYLTNDKKILKPTPIQMQGFPTAMCGRDMTAIAFTGSGKTIVFVLPMIALAMEEEKKLPVVYGEGPFGLVICPSRELARQTYEVTCEYANVLLQAGYPPLKTLLCIGGLPMKDQTDEIRRGIHIVVATPGRLMDMLNRKKFTLRFCKLFVLDEADRLVDLGFEEDIRTVMDHFSGQRQTLLFSATMPKKIQHFVRSALVKPVEVNVGRAGAANLDVIQEVEYVKQEAKIVYLLQCLQKTAPPVLIFCENKNDVDDIHEYLLLKGVDAVAIHGSKDQDERDFGVKAFKEGKKDVLVATDIASKGLDFPDIQHVVNFDMPKEIDSYVHRIGRTGRCGRTGVATTFINKNNPESVLLDLKHLLIESRQRVPNILLTLKGPEEEEEGNEEEGQLGCAYCAGLGHKIADCPKMMQERMKAARTRDFSRDDRPVTTGGGDW